jgi:putative phage-type endonuclease
LEFYRDLSEITGFELETAGVLRAGRRFWALARTGKSAALKGNDVVHNYLLLATSCDGTLATMAIPTSVRVVCNNTLAVALQGAAGNGAIKVPHSILQHPKVSWMLANIDREVIGSPDVQILECKTAGLNGARLWRDGVPQYVQLQVMHQLAVTGKQAADVAVLVCGQELRIHRIQRDETMIAQLIALEEQFWRLVQPVLVRPHHLETPMVEYADSAVMTGVVHRFMPGLRFDTLWQYQVESASKGIVWEKLPLELDSTATYDPEGIWWCVRQCAAVVECVPWRSVRLPKKLALHPSPKEVAQVLRKALPNRTLQTELGPMHTSLESISQVLSRRGCALVRLELLHKKQPTMHWVWVVGTEVQTDFQELLVVGPDWLAPWGCGFGARVQMKSTGTCQLRSTDGVQLQGVCNALMILRFGKNA